MDLANIDKFLSNLGNNAGVANGALPQSQSLGQLLMQYIQGFGSTDPYGNGTTTPSGLDDIVASLTKTWTGGAADAFKAQIQTVRLFGIGLAAAADKTWNTQASGVKMPPVEMQYEFESLADYVGVLDKLNQIFSDIHGKYNKLGKDFDNWAIQLAKEIVKQTIQNQHRLSTWSDNWTVTVNVPTFAEFEGRASSGSGVLSIAYSQAWALDPGNSTVSYTSPEFGTLYGPKTINWSAWSSPYLLDDQNKSDIKNATRATEFLNYLPNLMADLADQYRSVRPPDPQDNSVLPKTNGSNSNSQSNQNYNGSWTPGVGGLGAGGGPYGGANGGPYHPGTYNPGSPNGGGYNPGSYQPGQYGESGAPGSPNAGGWNPTQLAGYNPNLGGSGFAPGSTGLAGGGLGSAGGGALAGAGGAVPGGGPGGAAGGPGAGGGLPAEAGAAGRGMPMAPMGGAGGGKEGKERQRAAWLSEDEDVWGAGDDGGDAVL